jgi:hypothetical protein
MLEASLTTNEQRSLDDRSGVKPTFGAGFDSLSIHKLTRGDERAQSLIEFAAASNLGSLDFARQALAPHLRDDQLPQRLIGDSRPQEPRRNAWLPFTMRVAPANATTNGRESA